MIRITIRPANDSELVPGAVVLCRTSPHGLVAHRIAGSPQEVGGPDGVLFLIRGDACPDGGELIGKDDVLGIISHVERGSKQFRVDRGSRLLLGKILAFDNNLLLWGRSCLNFFRRVAGRPLRYVQSRRCIGTCLIALWPKALSTTCGKESHQRRRPHDSLPSPFHRYCLRSS